ALEWYIRSAEQGQTAVQYQVGAKYFKGESIPQDYNEAARWWQLAADGGQVDAQFNLGLMYFRGLGMTQDDSFAADMFSTGC
ncbi:MAG: tetratricopeptide repeat protein, partial [Gammaproteobacteria bacterium]